MKGYGLELRLLIGVITTFCIIGILIFLSRGKKKSDIPKREDVFGAIFFRSIIMFFPVIFIISKNIYEVLMVILCLIFASILNTQYVLKMKN